MTEAVGPRDASTATTMKKSRVKDADGQDASKAKDRHPKVQAGDKAQAAAPPEDEADDSTKKGTDAAPAAGPTEAVDPVEELQAKVDKLEDSLLRAKADYQNLVRRSAADHSMAIRYANAELLKGLLSVIDDFERSLAAARESHNLQAVVEGVQLVYDNLLKALRAQGLERIVALHEPFDPNFHEALMQQPSENFPSDTVLEEVAKGYRLHDRVLRPTKVVVAKTPEDQATQPEEASASASGEGESSESD
jgi:molecular chaperone GrpE